jgi:hypothetical protein
MQQLAVVRVNMLRSVARGSRLLLRLPRFVDVHTLKGSGWQQPWGKF